MLYGKAESSRAVSVTPASDIYNEKQDIVDTENEAQEPIEKGGESPPQPDRILLATWHAAYH